MLLGGVLQGAGDTLLQSAATLTALVVRVALGYLGVHFGVLGYSGAWATTPVGWAAAAVITNVRYFTGGWKNKAIVRARGAE
jgi:Na+-driven multidrug efflux pump